MKITNFCKILLIVAAIFITLPISNISVAGSFAVVANPGSCNLLTNPLGCISDAIKSTIEYFFPLSGNSVVAKIIYALLLTITIDLISVWLIRISERIEGKNKEEKAAK
jgi:hypothetical protein